MSRVTRNNGLHSGEVIIVAYKPPPPIIQALLLSIVCRYWVTSYKLQGKTNHNQFVPKIYGPEYGNPTTKRRVGSSTIALHSIKQGENEMPRYKQQHTKNIPLSSENKANPVKHEQ